MKSTTREVRPLTGIRGVAALIVVFFHYFPDITIAGRTFLGKGYLAVDLFFMLSGLVLALNYATTVNSNASLRTYGTFILKRLIRIYPLYIVCTLVILAIAVARHSVKAVPFAPDMGPHLLMANLFLVQSWDIGRSLLAPAWSISVEFAAYLAFPVLVIATLETRWKVAITFGAVVMLLLFLGSLAPEVNGAIGLWQGDTVYPALRCLAGFSFGLLGYRAMQNDRVHAFFARSEVFVGITLITALCGCFELNDFLIWTMLFLCVLTTYANGKAANVAFGNPVVYLLGVISYSIYLGHALLWPYLSHIKDFSAQHFGPLAPAMSYIAPLAILLVGSYVMYELIEHRAKLVLTRWAFPRRSAAPSGGTSADDIRRGTRAL